MRILLLTFVSVMALADTSAPEAAPACHSASWRGIERAFAAWCKTHPGRGIHGSCNDWLHAFKQCSGNFEAAKPGWRIVVPFNDCHDPMLEVVPDGKSWRVKNLTMKSNLPSPRIPGPPGSDDFGLELDPSPSPVSR